MYVHARTQVHETLVALSPWAVVRMGDDEWCVDLPRGRRLSLAISPLGAITNAYFQGVLYLSVYVHTGVRARTHAHTHTHTHRHTMYGAHFLCLTRVCVCVLACAWCVHGVSASGMCE